jgi:hypothetical protein
VLRNDDRDREHRAQWVGGVPVVERRELKFELSASVAGELRDIVRRYLPFYEYVEGCGPTGVTTIYFDTVDHQFYQRARRSYDNHRKLRIKEYYSRDESGAYAGYPYRVLELKERRNGAVIKHRVSVPKPRIAGFLRGEDCWSDVAALQHGADREVRVAYDTIARFIASQRVEPASMIAYRRSVYQRDERQLRVTFDDQISVHPVDSGLLGVPGPLAPPALPPPVRRFKRVVLEIKCPDPELPPWLREVLKNHDSRRLSKFTTSIRILDTTSDFIRDARLASDSSASGDVAASSSGSCELDDTSMSNQKIQS